MGILLCLLLLGALCEVQAIKCQECLVRRVEYADDITRIMLQGIFNAYEAAVTGEDDCLTGNIKYLQNCDADKEYCRFLNASYDVEFELSEGLLAGYLFGITSITVLRGCVSKSQAESVSLIQPGTCYRHTDKDTYDEELLQVEEFIGAEVEAYVTTLEVSEIRGYDCLCDWDGCNINSLVNESTIVTGEPTGRPIQQESTSTTSTKQTTTSTTHSITTTTESTLPETQKPRDGVIYIGKELRRTVTFLAQFPSEGLNYASWYKDGDMIYSAAPQHVGGGFTHNYQNDAKYKIERTGNEINLIIHNLTLTDAGHYQARYTTHVVNTYSLIVSDGAFCATQSRYANVGDEITFFCSAEYEGDLVGTLSWYRPYLVLITKDSLIEEFNNHKRITNTYTTIATAAHDMEKHFCRLTFEDKLEWYIGCYTLYSINDSANSSTNIRAAEGFLCIVLCFLSTLLT